MVPGPVAWDGPGSSVVFRESVCFFVFCNRHWFKFPGVNLGVAFLPFTLTLTLAVPIYP